MQLCAVVDEEFADHERSNRVAPTRMPFIERNGGNQPRPPPPEIRGLWPSYDPGVGYLAALPGRAAQFSRKVINGALTVQCPPEAFQLASIRRIAQAPVEIADLERRFSRALCVFVRVHRFRAEAEDRLDVGSISSQFPCREARAHAEAVRRPAGNRERSRV